MQKRHSHAKLPNKTQGEEALLDQEFHSRCKMNKAVNLTISKTPALNY